jgi:hypothetical protein
MCASLRVASRQLNSVTLRRRSSGRGRGTRRGAQGYHREDGLAMLAHLGALGDVAEAREVHVRPRRDCHHRAVGELAGAGRALESRERERPGRLEHRAGIEKGVLDGGADLVHAHGEAVVEVALAEGEGQLARLLGRDAVGEEPDVLAADATPLAQRLGHRVRVVGLHANHTDGRSQLLHRRRHARREAAATHRNEDRPEVAGRLVQHLQADRALAGDHIEMIEGGDDRHPGIARQHRAVRCGVGVVVAHEVDRRPQASHRLHLDRRRRARHHDAAAQPEAHRAGGDALGMVSGGGGDHAGASRRLVERCDRVVGATELEREHRGQVLALEPHVTAEARAERGGAIERRGGGQNLGDPGVEDPPQHLVHRPTQLARSGGATSFAKVRSTVQS